MPRMREHGARCAGALNCLALARGLRATRRIRRVVWFRLGRSVGTRVRRFDARFDQSA
jgi:hypothetical protein